MINQRNDQTTQADLDASRAQAAALAAQDPYAGQIAYSDPLTHPGGSKGDYLQTVMNPGTTYAVGSKDYSDASAAHYQAFDQRNYMYGRSAGGADQAVAQAQNIGNAAYATGSNLLNSDTGYAQDARNRVAPTGDFTAQNAALGGAQNYGAQAMGYGQQLGSLENTQGPSAAQAQLATGTNQALSSQLALARSGRGFGGGASAMEQAQSNTAGIQANQANQAAMLRAQEDAAWRSRQAANLGNAAGIAGNVGGLQSGIAAQYGQQSTSNLSAALQSQAQSDQTALGYTNAGAAAYNAGVQQNLSGQGLQNNIRQTELNAGQGHEDAMLRAWAAQNNLNLAQQQRSDQQTAGWVQAAATAAPLILAAV